jgi:hypothetical protein
MSDWRARLRILRTGVCEWVDPDTGQIEVDLLSWRDRWNLFGVHSADWRWVRRFGERDCGCTFNPITRRKVLTKMDCPDHGVLPWMRDSFAEDWANDEEWKDWYADEDYEAQ